MRRCRSCVYPETKPELLFDDLGFCSACLSYTKREQKNWRAAEEELHGILSRHRRKDYYDCVVPVSGGKDSTYQALKMLEMGMRPLLVCATTDSLTPIGRRNLDNLKRYADLIEYTVNTTVRAKVAKIAMNEIGDLSLAEHMTIWGIPIRIAKAMGIRLVVYGELAQSEYGGPAGSDEQMRLTKRWREEYGGLNGLRVSDLVGRDGITEADLHAYRWPDDADDIECIWLGQFMPWNGLANAIYASAFGFEQYPLSIEQSLGGFENVDNYATGPRDWMRFCKFGYARATDIVCNLIRRDVLTRQDGLRILREREKFPWTYLGKPIEEILKPFDITLYEFIEACNRFTNRTLFDVPVGRPLERYEIYPRGDFYS